MQSKHSLNWNNLKIILEISRAGSLTAAAQVMGMNQSTVGRRLSAIEGDLGCSLFVRSKSGFIATEQGSAVIARAREIEQTCEVLRDEISASEQAAVGRVRLSGNAWTLTRIAQHGLAQLLQEIPRLDIHLDATPPPTPIRGDATISLWFEAPPNASDVVYPLGQVAYSIYQSAQVDSAPGSWVRFLDDTAERPIISRYVNRFIQPDEHIRLTGSDAAMLLQAVREGIGKGLLPMCLAQGDPGLKRLTNGPPDAERTLKMHINSDLQSTRRVKAVSSWLVENFEAIFGVN